jgi:hypothetical protein
MNTIQKLININHIDIIKDVLSIIKNLWLTSEKLVIKPPTEKEWCEKCYDNFNYRKHYCNEAGIIFAEINGSDTFKFSFNRELDHLNNFTFLDDCITYNINDRFLLKVILPSNVLLNKLFYDKTSFGNKIYSNELISFYYFK